MFTAPLATASKFVLSAVANSCMWSIKGRGQSCVRRFSSTRWRGNLKGLSQDAGRVDFCKNLLASLCMYNKGLSNEPNFGRIHLAGQYLYCGGGGVSKNVSYIDF